MHAIGPRVNVFFTHIMSMLFVLVGIGSSVSYFQLKSSTPIVELSAREISFLRQLHRERCDQAYVTFDLGADFRKMWSWNINHMYVYVVAEYASESHPRNEVIIWDSIVSSREKSLIIRSKQMNKYSLKDFSYGLRGLDVTLKFKYNILPYMGPLFYGELGNTTFTIPANYTSKTVKYK